MLLTIIIKKLNIYLTPLPTILSLIFMNSSIEPHSIPVPPYPPTPGPVPPYPPYPPIEPPIFPIPNGIPNGIELPYAGIEALLLDLINITALGFGIILILLCILIILKLYD